MGQLNARYLSEYALSTVRPPDADQSKRSFRTNTLSVGISGEVDSASTSRIFHYIKAIVRPMSNNFLLTNRVGVLATKHHKEKVMTPLLQKELGIKVIVPQDFDTDAFGTFTREIKRPGDQLEAARLKAKEALNQTGETLAFASEGTFGPHPYFPFVAWNREIVVLVDTLNELELVGEVVSSETNYKHQTIKTLEEALSFANQVGFPEHGLVVMLEPHSQDHQEIIKGIVTEQQLTESVEWILAQSPNGKAHIETDMRALYNPTRMRVIEQATLDLIRKINQVCPKCSYPGFDVTARKEGLPCEWCSFPTTMTLMAIYQCQQCGFSQDVLFPDGVEKAEPAQCMYCNP